MISCEQFEAELEPLRAALEARRKKFLHYYYAGIACAALLLGSAIFCPQTVLRAIQNTLGVHAPLKTSDTLAYQVFMVLCAAMLTLGPVMSYRGQRGFSVERAVFARIVGLFGDITAARGGNIRAADVRKAPLFAPPLLFSPEEGVIGEMNGVRVRFCQAAFFRREEGRDALVFNGLFILCDLPQGTIDANQDLIRGVLAQLAVAAKAFPQEKEGWDEKLAYGLSAAYARLREAFALRMGKNELPAEKEYRLKYAKTPLLVRAGVPQAEESFCEPYGFEYSQERCLAAIAGHGGLFRLGSLFAPALASQRMRHLYEVMESIGGFTRHLRPVA